MADAPWSVIAAQASGGASMNQLAEFHGIPVGTIKSRSSREGWFKNSPVEQPNAARVIERSVGLLPSLGEKSKLRSAKVGDSMLRTIQKKRGDEQLREVPRYAQVVDTLATVHGWNQVQPSTSNVTVQLLNQVQIPDSKG